ncbi:unnamed protein product [Rhizoctonia solani]|uniref:DUF6533 domain-containing protein n=1 Tax=Rhizoctonia solani TaxID=456999 RepID=A0A8H3H8C0_9AGAM|nr:unnamed protein product [Rhizoctonia solani]
MPASGIKELETALFHAHVSRCTSYAGVCLLVYDHFLTFSEEVRLVWSRPTNIVSILFLINRYTTPLILAVDVYDKGGLTEQLNTQFCKVWFVAEGYMNFLLLAVIHLLMVVRVNALYGKHQKITYLLYTAYALYFTTTFAIITPGMFQALKTTFLFGLTAYKAWSYSQEQMNVPVARTLYRDGFQYYVVIILCSLFPLLIWTKAPSTLNAMPKYAGMAIVNTMGFRLVLNLRQHTQNSIRVSAFESYEMTPSPSPRTTEFPHKRHTRALGDSIPRFIGQYNSDCGDKNATDSCFDLCQANSKERDLELGVNTIAHRIGAAKSQEGERSRARVSLSLKLGAANSQLELDTVSIQSASTSRLNAK